MDPHSQVVELLARWEEARAAGRDLTPDELCGEHPELLGAVRAGPLQLRPFDP